MPHILRLGSLTSQTYFTRACILRAPKSGAGETWCIWTGFCVRCGNVGSTNHIAVSDNQNKQHMNITCSKWTLVLFNHRTSKSTAIVPVRPYLSLTRLYRWQYPGPRATSELDYSALRSKQELPIRHFLRGSDVDDLPRLSLTKVQKLIGFRRPLWYN